MTGNNCICSIVKRWYFEQRLTYQWGSVAQWVARLTRKQWMPVSREFEPIKGLHCFLEQEILPLLLSTGWFQEGIQA